jgi:two-component system, OmpR family, alkaline phosphatase synthesis response regulator PhoP
MSKIMILDDDKSFIDSTSTALKGAGFTVVSAIDAANGKKMIESEKPDLILLDVTLSQAEDGLVLGKDIFKQGIKTPLIILESVAKVATMSVDAADLAVEAYAEKPVDMEKIITKVKAILNRTE